MFAMFRTWLASLCSQNSNTTQTAPVPRIYIALDVALVLCVSAGSFLFMLGNTHFWEQDEGFYAATALEMFQRSDWIVPTFNQELFAHKPPLMFWGIQLGYWLCGVGESGARLLSAMAATGTCLFTYVLASKLFDRLVGVISAISLATNLMFCVVARSATADAYLSLFVTASLALCFLAYWHQFRLLSRLEPNPSPVALASEGTVPICTLQILQSISAQWWVAAYTCMGLAVLAKGPIGFLFPITILAASFWLECLYFKTKSLAQSFHPMHMLRVLFAMRLHWGVGIVLMVAAPWFVLVDMKSDGKFLQEFIGVHHLGRFSNAMDNHSGPFYYYGLACLLGFYPWSGFAIPTAICWFSRLFRPNSHRVESRALLWLSVWFSVYLIVFSMARTKLPNYVLPAYPVLAIGAAYYLRAVVRAPQRWAGWQTLAFACFLLVGAVISVSPFAAGRIPALAPHFNRIIEPIPHGEGLLLSVSLTGVPLMLLGVLGIGLQLWARRSKASESSNSSVPLLPRQLAVPVVVSMASLLFVTHLSYSLAPQVDQLQSPQILVQRARALSANELGGNAVDDRSTHRSTGPLPLTVISMFRPTLVYYAGGRVDFVGREDFVEAVQKSLAKGEQRYWLVQQEDWENYKDKLPTSVAVLDSATNFPKPGNLYVVGHSLDASE